MKNILIRNTVILIGITAFCMLSLLSMLIYFNIQKRYCEFRDSSVHFITSDVVTVIEKGLNLGLRCEEMQNIPSILEKQSHVASFVMNISVYKKNGNILYTTAQKIDNDIPEKIIEAFRKDSLSKPIQTKSGLIGTYYVPVKNGIGITDVIVSINYERYNNTEFSSLKIYFILFTLILSIVITLISIIPIRIIFKSVDKSLFSFSVSENDTDGINGNDVIEEARKEIEYLISDIEATADITKQQEHVS